MRGHWWPSGGIYTGAAKYFAFIVRACGGVLLLVDCERANPLHLPYLYSAH